MTKFRFSWQTPIHRQECYECDCTWHLRWPIHVYRLYVPGPFDVSALPTIVSEFKALQDYEGIFRKEALVMVGNPTNVYGRVTAASILEDEIP